MSDAPVSFWDRFRRPADPPEEVEAPSAPERTRWHLTLCPQCKRVAWFGIPIPHLVTTDGSYDQLVRVNYGGGHQRRVVVNQPMRLVMGKLEQHPWCCPCGGTDGRVAATAEQVWTLTQFAMRQEG